MVLASVASAAKVFEPNVDFWIITILLAGLFAFFGFIQGPGKAALNAAGIFLAYGTAIKTADFTRKAINFIIGTKWDEATLPIIKLAVFLFAFLIMFTAIRFIVKANDRFSAKLIGGAIGAINGTMFTTLVLEFMAKYWKDHPPDAKFNMDLSWAFRLAPGNLRINMTFTNNPVVVHNVLDKGLKFLLYAMLFLVIPPVFFGLIGVMKKITTPILNFLGLSEEQKQKKKKKEA